MELISLHVAFGERYPKENSDYIWHPKWGSNIQTQSLRKLRKVLGKAPDVAV